MIYFVIYPESERSVNYSMRLIFSELLITMSFKWVNRYRFTFNLSYLNEINSDTKESQFFLMPCVCINTIFAIVIFNCDHVVI